jgi:hypothetical protein
MLRNVHDVMSLFPSIELHSAFTMWRTLTSSILVLTKHRWNFDDSSTDAEVLQICSPYRLLTSRNQQKKEKIMAYATTYPLSDNTICRQRSLKLPGGFYTKI